MFRRIWGYLIALFGIKLDALEDPEVLLKQAQDEMTAAHARNREQAVQALTQKNNLQVEVDRTVKEIGTLQGKAETALKTNDRDLALQLLREKQAREANLASLQESLANAIKMTDQIKVALQREEERIRTKTAQAMALKTQWKQAEIEKSLNNTMGKFTVAGTDAAFERAASKISNAQSESAARSELSAGTLDGRIAALNDSQADAAANSELSAMEAKLSLESPATASATTTSTSPSTSTSDVEKELQDLEAKVNAGGGGTSGG